MRRIDVNIGVRQLRSFWISCGASGILQYGNVPHRIDLRRFHRTVIDDEVFEEHVLFVFRNGSDFAGLEQSERNLLGEAQHSLHPADNQVFDLASFANQARHLLVERLDIEGDQDAASRIADLPRNLVI